MGEGKVAAEIRTAARPLFSPAQDEWINFSREFQRQLAARPRQVSACRKKQSGDAALPGQAQWPIHEPHVGRLKPATLQPGAVQLRPALGTHLDPAKICRQSVGRLLQLRITGRGHAFGVAGERGQPARGFARWRRVCLRTDPPRSGRPEEGPRERRGNVRGGV